jgi:hypothetical protein
MTQDQDGPEQGTGAVVSGEVVTDDGTDESRLPAASTVTTPDDQDHADTRAEPGEADLTRDGLSDLACGSLVPDASEYRQRWRQVQFRFVDDPQGSVAEAADVIAQVTAELEAAIAERQRSLRASWSEGAPADTETLRATLLRYRAFLDQLTGLGS